MAPTHSPIRHWGVILEELKSAILAPDDIDLDQVNEQVTLVLETIRTRRRQCHKSRRVGPRDPSSVGYEKPTTGSPQGLGNQARSTSCNDPELDRDDESRTIGSRTARPRVLNPKGNPRHSSKDWVGEVLDALGKNKSGIEHHVKLSPEHQIEFDWTQYDVRVYHILGKDPDKSDNFLCSLACRSVALDLEEWSNRRAIVGRAISQDKPGGQAPRGEILEFINTHFQIIDGKRDKFFRFIAVGRKMLEVERELGCGGIPTIMAFAWRSFRFMGEKRVPELCLKMRGHWVLQIIQENRQCLDENILFYQEKCLTWKRQRSSSLQDDGLASKRCRLDVMPRRESTMGNHVTATNPSNIESSDTDRRHTSEEATATATVALGEACTAEGVNRSLLGPHSSVSLGTTADHRPVLQTQMIQTGWSNEYHATGPTSGPEGNSLDHDWQPESAVNIGDAGLSTLADMAAACPDGWYDEFDWEWTSSWDDSVIAASNLITLSANEAIT